MLRVETYQVRSFVKFLDVNCQLCRTCLYSTSDYVKSKCYALDVTFF